jgi:hypothetical protein
LAQGFAARVRQRVVAATRGLPMKSSPISRNTLLPCACSQRYYSDISTWLARINL